MSINDVIQKKQECLPVSYLGKLTDYYYYNDMLLSSKHYKAFNNVFGNLTVSEKPVDYFVVKQKGIDKKLSRFYIKREMDAVIDEIYRKHKDAPFVLHIDGPRITGKSHLVERYGLRNYNTIISINALNLEFNDNLDLNQLIADTVKSQGILDFTEDKNSVLIIDDFYRDSQSVIKWLEKQDIRIDVVVIHSYNLKDSDRRQLAKSDAADTLRIHAMSYKDIDTFCKTSNLYVFNEEIYQRIGGLPLTVKLYLRTGDMEAVEKYSEEVSAQLLNSFSSDEENFLYKIIVSYLFEKKINLAEILPYYWSITELDAFMNKYLSLGIIEFEDGKWKLTDMSYLNYLQKKVGLHVAKEFSLCYNDYVIKTSQITACSGIVAS